MDILDLVVNLFTNTDAFLVSLATDYGTLIYAAMFLIFFLETGFVIMSFLPGDSLLFVAGTVAASGTASPWLIMLAVIVGAGYLFGNIPFIKNNLSLILLLGIVAAISGPVLVGMVWKFIQKRKGLDAEDPQK